MCLYILCLMYRKSRGGQGSGARAYSSNYIKPERLIGNGSTFSSNYIKPRLRVSENERIMNMERDQRDWNEQSQLQAKASADGMEALAAVLAAQVAQQLETNRLLASIVNRDREPAPVTEPDTPSRTSSRAANARPARSAPAK